MKSTSCSNSTREDKANGFPAKKKSDDKEKEDKDAKYRVKVRKGEEAFIHTHDQLKIPRIKIALCTI